jgi:hypothetical protein
MAQEEQKGLDVGYLGAPFARLTTGTPDTSLDLGYLGAPFLPPETTIDTEPPPATPFTLINPGAELGASYGWSVEEGSFAQRSASPDPHSGSNYFYGAAGPVATMRQRFNLLDNGVDSSDIDSEALCAKWGGWIASFDGLNDPVNLGFRFLNYLQEEIETYWSGFIIPPALTWDYFTIAWPIPAGARYLDVLYNSTRTAGTNNDGYADDFDDPQVGTFAELTTWAPDAVPVINGGFENLGTTHGTFGPWVAEVGTWERYGSNGDALGCEPHSGDWLSYFSVSPAGRVVQRLPRLDALGISAIDIDAGGATITLDGYFSGDGDGDTGGFFVRCLDADGHTLSEHQDTQADYFTDAGEWTNKTYQVTLTTGTRFVEIGVEATRVAGSNLNFYFDDLSASFAVTPAPSSSSEILTVVRPFTFCAT